MLVAVGVLVPPARCESTRMGARVMAEVSVPFTEVVDSRAGVIRARGRLTVQAADLLSGAVLALREGGHRRVLLDLEDLQGAEDAGLLMLQHLQTAVTAEGGSLVVLHPPAGGAW